MRRNDYLIKRKFNSYLVPSVLMIMAMQLGNIVDGILVSAFIDIDGMTAISLSLPVIFFIQIFGFAIGVGGAVVISVQLGKRQINEASSTFSVSLISVLIISLVFSVLTPFISTPLANILASTDVLRELLTPYLFWFMLLTPVLNLCLLLSNVITVDNCPKLGAATFIVANVVNLILDYVFLRFTDMGMSGAALSTMIGYACGNLVLIPYLLSKKRMLRFRLIEGFKRFKELGGILKAGASQASFLLMMILQFFILNTFIQNTLGADNMAIYAVCINSVDIIKLFIEGIIGVIQTIGGILYGEKDYFGIRRLVRRTIIFTGVTVAALTAIFLIFPNLILMMFSFNKPELYDTAILCVRLYSISFIFFAANRIVQVYYQTTLHPFLSTLNTVLQGFVLLLPLSLLFIGNIGIIGVSIAAAVTEALSFFTVCLWRVIRQKQGKLPQKGFLMIPEKDSDSLYDISIKSTEQEAVAVSEQLVKCCEENRIPSEVGSIIGVTAEELSVNIARYGYKKSSPSYIDINLSKADDKLLLRIRDDGVPFNPTEYNSDESDEFLLTGIQMIRRISDDMSYTRVLNMNNTVIEVACRA